jgi:hypothetical protein
MDSKNYKNYGCDSDFDAYGMDGYLSGFPEYNAELNNAKLNNSDVYNSDGISTLPDKKSLQTSRTPQTRMKTLPSERRILLKERSNKTPIEEVARLLGWSLYRTQKWYDNNPPSKVKLQKKKKKKEKQQIHLKDEF